MTQILKLTRDSCIPSYRVFNGDTSSINYGSGATLDNLTDAAMTVEAWIYLVGWGEADEGHIACKSNRFGQWGFWLNSLGQLATRIECDTTDAESISAAGLLTLAAGWYHVAMTWNDAGAPRVIRLWCRTPGATSLAQVAAYSTQTAGVGAIKSDGALDFYVGNNLAGVRGFDGWIGWQRVSNSVRYTPGNTYTLQRCGVPPVDANTMLLSFGGYDYSGNGNTGTASNTTTGCDCVETELDLLDTSGLGVRSGDDGPGWVPAIMTPNEGGRPDRLIERIPLWLIATSHDAVAAKMQTLDRFRVWADQYVKDIAQEYAVWLRAKLDGETGERRALVRQIVSGWEDEHYGISSGRGSMPGSQPRLVLALEREPYWEQPDHGTFASGTTTLPAAASVIHDYTGTAVSGLDIAGDATARIARLSVEGETITDYIKRLWIGLRSTQKHGAVQVFKNIWEMELGALGTDAALAADVTASPGGAGNTKVRVTPGTTTWAGRASITLEHVTTQYAEQYGEFLWLLRLKVTADPWEVFLRFYYGSDTYIDGPIVRVNNTSWRNIPLGRAMIPLRDLRILRRLSSTTEPYYSATWDKGFAVRVFGRRPAGAGSLDLDCLCPIPLDEGSLMVELATQWPGPSVEFPGEGGGLVFSESPTGSTACLTYVEGIGAELTFEDIPIVLEADNFRLPPGDGRMIIVFEGDAADITQQVTIHPRGDYYVPCWHSLRGAN